MLTLPNIRRQFIPDANCTICDADLSGADAQVVAWEANDSAMKSAFRAGKKIHITNARDMFPEVKTFTDNEIKDSSYYKLSKLLCHATSYLGKPPNLSQTTGLPISTIQDFQSRWFIKHPGILEWHNRTRRHLEGSECWNCNQVINNPSALCPTCHVKLANTVKNRFNYRRIYHDTPDKCLAEAIAWVPQSTIAIVTQRGLFALREYFPYIQILLQVHDSLTFQLPTNKLHELTQIRQRLNSVIVPYEDELCISWDIGTGENWSEC